MNPHAAPLAAPRPPHPFLYALLIVPFGASSGFVTVALAYLCTKRGLSVEDGAILVSWSMFPNVWKFLWAPIGDRTLDRKRWYVISTVLSSLLLWLMCVVPLAKENLALLSFLIAANSVVSTFTGFAVEGMVAHLTPPDDRGRTSGWFQAGNLGGAGVGGGLGLWLVSHLSAPLAGGLLAIALCLCALPLLWMPNVQRDAAQGSLGGEIRHVTKDLWATLKSRVGLLCAVLCFLPLGTGAASAILTQASVAGEWHAGEHEVELVQGFLTGAISAVGSLAGGYVCGRWLNARAAYAVFGGLMALCTASMALAPHTVAMYVGLNLVYSFIAGLCYAAFSAFVLDAIAGANAATKYNGFASLSNLPIWYMGLVLAQAQTHLGSSGMLYTESLFGVVGIAVFALVAWGLARQKTVPAPEVA